MRTEVKIEILSYAKSQVGSFVIVLSELENSSRKLPIIIKSEDAQYIGMKLKNYKTPRPSIHDMFKLLTDSYNIDIQEMVIYSVSEGVFYAQIVTTNDLDTFNIECTIGDALSIAVLYECPIFVMDTVMNATSVDMNDDVKSKTITKKLPTKRITKGNKTESIEDLDTLLVIALETEDYEKAIELRDKIEKLKKV